MASLAELCPNMPEAKRSKLANASKWPWHVAGDVNQGDVFERKFKQLAGYYLAQAAGRDTLVKTIFQLFQTYKPVIVAAVKEFTYSTEKVNGEFMGDEARGAMETTMRPLVLDSFGSLAHVLSVTNYWQIPVALAENHIIPDNVNNAAGRTEVFTHDRRRAWLILGWAELIATIPVYDSVQEWINDSMGFRKPYYLYPHVAMTNLLLMEKGTPTWVETNHSWDADGFALSATQSGMWPIGVEVIVDPEIGLNLGWPTAAEH